MRLPRHLAYASVSLLTLAAPAFAQEAPPAQATPGDQPPTDAVEAAKESNEIIVSARRRDERLQDVPQTVNVVTSTEIDKLNLRNLQDVQALVPGLTMTSNGSFSSSATVRGVEFRPEASGNNPTVEFYLNDAVISSNFLFQSIFDIGQFELLRGPVGTLRGRAAPSGAITVTTRRPDLHEAGFVMNVSQSDRHARKVDAALNYPIIPDVLAIRLAGVIDNNRGNDVFTVKEASDPTHNPSPFRYTRAGRASVRFKPTDWIEGNFMYQKLHATQRQYGAVESASLVDGSAPAGQLIGPFDRLSIDDIGNPTRQAFNAYIGNLDVRFAGQKLSYVGSWNTQDFDTIGGSDAGDYFAPPLFPIADRQFADPVGFEAVCGGGAVRTGVNINNQNYFQCTHSLARRRSHELRLSSEERIAGVFDYTIGAFYDHNQNDNNLTSETPILISPSRLATISLTPIVTSGHSTEKSAFANVTAHLGTAIELSGGLRYIDYKDFNSITISGVAPTPNTSDHFHATIYNASAKYRFSEDLMVYATVGSSWRPGTHVIGDFSTARSARETQFLDLPPEKSTSFEIGLKSSFLDKRGRLNIDFYHQKFSNYVFRGPSVYFISTSATGPAPSTFNFVAGVPAVVDGVEAEASFQILPNWSINGNFSYANGRIKNGTIACTDLDRNGVPDTNVSAPTLAQLQAAVGPGQTVSQCAFSGRAVFVPKWSANIQSEAKFPIADRTEAFIRGLATIYPSNTQDPNNTFDDVPSYALVNLYGGVRDPHGRWELQVFAKNVFNREVILNRGSAPLSTTLRTLQPPTFRSVATSTFTAPYYSITTTPPREVGVSFHLALGSR
ncbi:MAG: TonB-dependent receptor [Novosphingobium sp.]|nr:TonB-dependent receptor [Novosphingobium sp.]